MDRIYSDQTKYGKFQTRRRFLKLAAGSASGMSFLMGTDAYAQRLRPHLHYDAQAAMRYAIRWSTNGNDCAAGQFSEDCTHFMSHLMSAGGVIVPGQAAWCHPWGLCTLVLELYSWFFNATSAYNNVSLITYDQANTGDFGFMRYDSGEVHHVFFLADKPVFVQNNPVRSGMRYYAHSNNRQGQFISEAAGAGNFRVRTCNFYRITQ